MIILRIITLLLISAVTTSAAQTFVGTATYYNDGLHGRKTTSGERYDRGQKTAAFRNLPIGTVLRISRPDNQKSTTVRVNDCGPLNDRFIIDLSRAAAEDLALIADGPVSVSVEVVKSGTGKMPCGDRYPSALAMTSRSVAQPVSYEKPVARLFPPVSRGAAAAAPTAAVVDSVPPNPVVIEPPVNATVRYELIQPITAGFAVQVASYRDLENAQQHARKLNERGFSRVLLGNQGNVYRVMIGPFTSAQLATSYRSNLQKKYKIKGFVTKL